jgi:hypothetical protein
MKKLIVLALFFSLNLFSQKHELGKVTIDELKEKSCSIDTSAVASILFNVGEVRFEYSQSKESFVMSTTVKTKIKIYKKEGYDWANKAVRYYIGGSSKERVSFSNVATYNLVDGKIEKSKLKSDGEFDEKMNKFWGRKKITLPNVKEGSIIEFEYTLLSESFGSLEDWNFQTSIPVLYSEFKTLIPEYFTYKPHFRGYFSPKTVVEKNNKSIILTSKERSEGKVVRTTVSSDQINFFETKTIYSLSNLPALKDEAYVNNIKNYITSIEHELNSIQFPNQQVKNFSTDWETVVKTIYENDDFGQELNKTGYFENDIESVLAGTTTLEQKLTAIFVFLKSRMNWNEFYSYSCDVGVKKAYQDKVGNAAEINLMLTAMFRYAGFEANPVIISTRGNGVSLSPSRTAFDYVITGVELNGQIQLFDATNKYSLPNILPIRDLNWFGRLIRKNGTSVKVDLIPTFNSKEVINIIAEINKEGEVKGKMRDMYFDYNAYIYRDNYNSVSKESVIERIEKKYNGIEISEYDVQNNLDLTKPIVESFAFTSNNSVEIIGDKIYFSPLLFLSLTENPFKQEIREYPIDFVFPHQDKYTISLKIPEGYSVESIPQSSGVTLPESMAIFKYSVSNTENQVQLSFTIDVNQSTIGSEYYEAIKQFFKQIVEKSTEKVVLKKV